MFNSLAVGIDSYFRASHTGSLGRPTTIQLQDRSSTSRSISRTSRSSSRTTFKKDLEGFEKVLGVKSRFGLVPGALGGGLGSHFGSQGRLGQQKGARRPKCVHFWAPIWRPIFELFLDLLILFCTLFSSFHFGRYQNRFLMDFGAKMEAKIDKNS